MIAPLTHETTSAAARRRWKRKVVARGGFNTKVHNECREPGPVSLVESIIEQARCDYFILVRAGVIKDGKPTGYWPMQTGSKTSSHYSNIAKSEVRELLQFLKNELPELCHLAFDSRKINGDVLWPGILKAEREGRYQSGVIASNANADMVNA